MKPILHNENRAVRSVWPAVLLGCFAMLAAARAVPPRYDHIVVVIEENETLTQVIGNTTDAPYLNSLAAGGVSFTNFYAITHPSQANYLEFFSGSAQGVDHNGTPVGIPFSTPNLGARLIAAGFSFTGFSEDLPAPGDATTLETIDALGNTLYARKHNPWANWQDATVPTPANRLPPSVNQPFSAFPSDFATLPAVAFVVPNELHDMHDGTVRMADDWLAANLSAYAEWAKTHNSLLIVVWDEDDYSGPNKIPAILYGARLKTGPNASTWTLHNLLRTIEDGSAIAHSGSAALVPPITGVFAADPPVSIARFQKGVNGYTGAHDTHVRADFPTSSFGSVTKLVAATGAAASQPLIRFDDIFGSSAGRIPPGAQILSAKLVLTTGSTEVDAALFPVGLHRMLTGWTESVTWNSLTNGITADGIEAVAAAEFAATPALPLGPALFDATATVQLWQNGAANLGWVLLSTDSDAWQFNAAESPAAPRPALEVTYTTSSSIEFSAPGFAADESGGPATITVTRTGPTIGSASVNYASSAGSATAGSDYTTVSGTLTWPAGDSTPRTFAVPISSDSLVEADETVALALSGATGAAVLASCSAATLTIKETPFNAWRVAKFGANANASGADPDADPDHDGMTNYFEYALGSEPLNGASRGAPQIAAGASLAITFTRVPAANDVTIVVQVSGDMQTWHDGSSYSESGCVPSNAWTTELSRTGTSVETIAVRDNVPVSGASARYLRLRLIRQ